MLPQEPLLLAMCSQRVPYVSYSNLFVPCVSKRVKVGYLGLELGLGLGLVLALGLGVGVRVGG